MASRRRLVDQKRFPHIFEEQKGRCFYCKCKMIKAADADPMLPNHKPPERATTDHKIPRSRKGGNERANVCIACVDCNQAKGQMTEAEFRHRKAAWLAAKTAAYDAAGNRIWSRSW